MATLADNCGTATMLVKLRYRPGIDPLERHTNRRTSTSLTTFFGFGRLPPELQDMIWREAAYEERRIVTILFTRDSLSILAAERLNLLLVNRSSYKSLRPFYTRIGNGQLYPHVDDKARMGPLVSFENDIFLIQGNSRFIVEETTDCILEDIFENHGNHAQLRYRPNDKTMIFRHLVVDCSIKRFAFDNDLMFSLGAGVIGGRNMLLWSFEADQLWNYTPQWGLFGPTTKKDIEDFENKLNRLARRRLRWLTYQMEYAEDFRDQGRDMEADILEEWTDRGTEWGEWLDYFV